MATATAKTKMEQVCALWKKQSKDGKKVYFSGKVEATGEFLTGFYNTNKKNMKEPDLRVYLRDDSGNLSKETFIDLWCNPTKNGKKVLSGKLNGKRIVGFINEKASEKQPYISVYYSDELSPAPEAKEEKKASTDKKAPKFKKKEEPKFEEVTEDDLPF